MGPKHRWEQSEPSGCAVCTAHQVVEGEEIGGGADEATARGEAVAGDHVRDDATRDEHGHERHDRHRELRAHPGKSI
eukprot:2978515-Prymnesium_polylepis.1